MDIIRYIMIPILTVIGLICSRAYGQGESVSHTFSMCIDDVSLDTICNEETISSVVKIRGCNNTWDADKPSVPVKYYTFQVPTYSKGFNVSIESFRNLETIKLSEPIIIGKLYTTNGEALKNQDNATTENNCNSSSPVAYVCNEYYINGCDHMVTVALYPSSYDETDLSVKLYTDIIFSLTYDICSSDQLESSPIIGGDTKMIEPNIISETLQLKTTDASGAISKDEVIKNYVIITPKSLKQGSEKLSMWKRQKGYNVKVQTVEDILNSTEFKVGANETCFDKESSVREWMKDYYKKQGAFFCLFIGDYHTSSPIRYFYSSISGGESSDSKYVPTDCYFTDLVSNWTFTKESNGKYVTNVYTAAYSPTIPVGRLLCSTNEEIERYIDKLLLYEIYPGRGNTSYLGKATLARTRETEPDWHNCLSFFDMPNEFNVEIFKDNNAEQFSDLRPLPKDILTSMNNAGLYSWQLHGGPISLQCSKVNNPTGKWPQARFIIAQKEYSSFHDRYTKDTNHSLDCLDNYDRPAIAYSISCKIAPFDNYKEYYEGDNRYNIGSAFTVAGNYGGVALLGNTRDGYFTYSDYMEYEFSKHIMSNSCIGISHLLSKLTIPKSQDQYTKHVVFTHNIIGDPEIDLWTKIPNNLSGTMEFTSNGIIVKGASLNTGAYGFKCGSKITRNRYSTSNGSIKIPSDNLFSNGIGCQIATIYIKEDGYLPYTQFLTSGKTITGYKDEINTVNANFGPGINMASAIDINRISPYLNLGSNSDISIYALNRINSDCGIIVNNNGKLQLRCDGLVTLKGDIVKQGGLLTVKSNNIRIESGFKVEKGGSFKTQN